ncbi:hypothetical protein Dsin_023944 [Dipteronia sinensis]|uniref:Kinesin motor domain-containing protein n=1 Tax=Dipteronia sinensis TaxID=43782 RepID=A0AAE0E1I7_9ROSI|nr:hypothetical protein Dsin_023944 [Dipteronia sinensis]
MESRKNSFDKVFTQTASQDAKGLVNSEGLTEVQIPDVTKARWWYNKGRRVRSTSWTSVNEASSRSHCLTRITIFRHGDALEAKREVSKLWMVDLGGSERLLKTGATGQTLDEGRAINLSLSALADVIAALRRKRGHVPYSYSKQTQIPKDSLDEEKNLISPKETLKESVETPRISEKAIRRSISNSLPLFVTSTVASRQRQGAAEGEISVINVLCPGFILQIES